MLKRLSFVLVLAAAACGGGSKKAVDTTANAGSAGSAAPAAGGPVHLELAEIKITDLNKNESLLIHADGVIEVDGAKPAKVTADGKIMKIDGTEVGMSLGADGSINGPDGKPTGARLDATGGLTAGNQTISIDDQGNLVGGNPDAPKLHIDGATTPALKRTALLVLVMLMGSGEADAPPPPPTVRTP